MNENVVLVFEAKGKTIKKEDIENGNNLYYGETLSDNTDREGEQNDG